MTDSLYRVCDREIFENESVYEKYIATLRKKNDKSLYGKSNFNNIKLNEVNKILSE